MTRLSKDIDLHESRSAEQLTAFDRTRSSQRAAAGIADSTPFIELWPTNPTTPPWGGTTVLAIASGVPGKVYSTNTSPFSINHTMLTVPLRDTDKLRFSGVVNHVLTSGTRGAWIGVTRTAGVNPVAGFPHTDTWGIYVENDGKVMSLATGTVTDLGLAAQSSKAFRLTIWADENFISCCARAVDNSIEARARFTRSGKVINNVLVGNSDTGTTAGSSIEGLGARVGGLTVSPRVGVEGKGADVLWTSQNGNNVRVAVPASYDSRVPCRVILGFHGFGSDETLFGDHANTKTLVDPMLDAGYIILSTAYTPANATWGNQNGRDANRGAFRFLLDNFNVSTLSFFANSMGTVDALNALQGWARNRVRSLITVSPTYSLVNLHADADFTSSVRSAYGINGSGTDFVTKTEGYRPENFSADIYRMLPVMTLVATDDTLVDQTANGAALLTAARQTSPEVREVTGITGGHSFTYSPYAGSILEFIDRHAG